MSDTPKHGKSPASSDAALLLERVRAAEAGADAAARTALDDLALDDRYRLDDRTRASFWNALERLVAGVIERLREQVANPVPTEVVVTRALPLLGTDERLMTEYLAHVRFDLLVASIPYVVTDDIATLGLLIRLSRSSDNAVATAATGLFKAQGRSLAGVHGAELPPIAFEQLLWPVAAAFRDTMDDPDSAVDRVVAQAARQLLDNVRAMDRTDTAALRLAQAIDPQPEERAPLIEESLRDRQVMLAIALIAQGLDIPVLAIRNLLVDPQDDRLWLALRAVELPRETIARIGLVLCEADPRRDLDSFVAMLDAVMSVDLATARFALVPLGLDGDYRAAQRVLRSRRS